MGIRNFFSRFKRTPTTGVVRTTNYPETQMSVEIGREGAEIIKGDTDYVETGSTGAGIIRGDTATTGGGATGGGGGGSSGEPTTPAGIATGSPTPAQLTGESAAQAAEIRAEAARTGVDISTPAREVGYIARIKSGTAPSEIQEEIKPTKVVPIKRETQARVGFLGSVTDFFTTKPDISRMEDQGFFRGGLEYSKYLVVQPFSGLKQEVAIGGKELQTSESRIVRGTGIGVEGASLLVPETPVGVAILGAVPLLKYTPTVARATVSTGFGVTGTAEALDKSLTPQERVAGGIIGGLGFAGVGSEIAVPYLRGGLARFSKDYKPIEAEQTTLGGKEFTVKFIKGAGTKADPFDIGIIPEGGKRASGKGFKAGEGAVVRGGYGFSTGEQLKAFTGKELRLTSVQANIKPQGGKFVSDPAVSELGFFFSPADPITGKPQARISRTGLSNIFDTPTVDSGGAAFSRGQPKVIVTEPTKLGTKATRISPKDTGELEITSTSNIEVLGSGGVTVSKGQRLDIVLGRLTDAPITKGTKTKAPSKIGKGDIISSTAKTSQFISPSGTAGSFFGTSRVISKSFFRGFGSSNIMGSSKSPISPPRGKQPTYSIPSISTPSTSKPPRSPISTKYFGSLTPSRQATSGFGKDIFGSKKSPIIKLPKMKMVETKTQITGTRGFQYQPGLAALGLNLFDTKESPLAWTGLATRKRIRRKKK